MGIFDDVVMNAKSAVNVVGKKAEQLVDLSKLKYAESGIHHEIEEKLRDLGSFVYESTVSGETDAKLLEKKIEQLTELYQQLEMTREMLAAEKNKKCCKACGSVNDKEAFICYKCGAKLQKDKKSGQPSKEKKANEKSANAGQKPKNTAEDTSTQ
ncbi:MAG: zinc ribbon domain-containing protein [Acutalibacteraceae bacterium]|nr:zinc ribbon domain-containing protein [Acutalibacteraceae bacterium]HIR03639.1 zinc ribbon domain-containing protein [Candidatus Scatovicinus merdipullorum]